jgi:hypothetical protein
MKALKTLLTGTICMIAVSLPLQAEVHPDVQAALDWQFPEHNCVMKKVTRSGDPTTRERKMKKAVRKFKKCFSSYEEELKSEEAKLLASAEHGLSKPQAEVIAGHINRIRWVLTKGADAVDEAQNPGDDKILVDTDRLWDPST